MVVRVTGTGVHRFLKTYFDFRTLIEQNDMFQDLVSLTTSNLLALPAVTFSEPVLAAKYSSVVTPQAVDFTNGMTISSLGYYSVLRGMSQLLSVISLSLFQTMWFVLWYTFYKNISVYDNLCSSNSKPLVTKTLFFHTIEVIMLLAFIYHLFIILV